MKKYLTLATSLLAMSSVALAEEKPAQPAPASEAKPPMMVLYVLDSSSKVARPLQTTTYSVKNSKTHQLCWTAVNVPFKASNEVVENFVAPAESTFVAKNGSVISSKDKTKHEVTYRKPSVNNESIGNCWRFDNTDPKGQYSLQVRVNEVQFPTQTFTITE
ncbi:hypothetical protein B0187_07500 [Haemophilus paracuniculus]|uniref:Pseudouridine synthase n=1 Tax=Haemophilus paracuniculus TaxID=734 RepID=A0A1T0AS79_9PAST|nr:hypothetical protein [Haemophilus paracuniculus]OOR98718.1 hypothetical protein B0187_07500 [Haemophilus paracuniculus]